MLDLVSTPAALCGPDAAPAPARRPGAGDPLLLLAAIGCLHPAPRLRLHPLRGTLDAAGEVLLALHAGAPATPAMRGVLRAAQRMTEAQMPGAWPDVPGAADDALACPVLWAAAWLAEELVREGIASMPLWRALAALCAAATAHGAAHLADRCAALLAELDHWQPTRLLARALADDADA